MKIKTGHNSGLAKVAAQCSADTFVVNQTLVLRINICGKNRYLRQASSHKPQAISRKLFLLGFFLKIGKLLERRTHSVYIYTLRNLLVYFYLINFSENPLNPLNQCSKK